MILLFSGGMDSYIAWYYLRNPKTLYIDLNHRYSYQERTAVLNLIPSTYIDKRLDLHDWEEEDANIPMRNAFFAMIASQYDKEIALVVQKGEMTIPDRSPEFFRNFGSWISWMRGKSGYKITSPFFEMTKTEMVSWYVNRGEDPKLLIETRSCFGILADPCGKCGACFRRWVALTNNGLEEEYVYPITEWEGITHYIEKMKAGKYDPQMPGAQNSEQRL